MQTRNCIERYTFHLSRNMLTYSTLRNSTVLHECPTFDLYRPECLLAGTFRRVVRLSTGVWQTKVFSDVNLTGRLHGTIVGPTGRSDWSVRPRRVSTRFDSRIGSRTKSNMFDSSNRLSDRSDEAFTRYDRRTDQSDRPDIFSIK